jgi:hypothetical protein
MHQQLFLDDWNIQRMDGLSRRAHPAKRYSGNPIIVRQYPWEETRVQLYGRCILFNPERKRYQMYYIAQAGANWYDRITLNGREQPAHSTLPCLAESADGVHWERPMLGQCSFNEIADTNILDLTRGQSFEGGALYDPADPDPARRFKIFFWDQRAQLLPKGKQEYDRWGYDCICRVRDDAGKVIAEQPYNDWGMEVAFSPDGVRWTRQPGPVFRCYSDTGNSALYDPVLKRYVGFGRFNLTRLANGGLFNIGRGIARVESEDFLHWSEPELVVEADSRDPDGFQINSMPVDLYEGIYLGLVEDFGIRSDPHYVPALQLAASRDGRRWTRAADRAPIVEPPAEGAWDAGSPTGGSIRPATGIFVHDDQARIYYCASSPNHPLSIGMAYWRRARFVSLHAEDEGELLTAPFVVDGPELHLNIHGEATVQVCDRQGKAIEEWACSRPSYPISGDHTDIVVRWPESNLPTLMGQAVTVRVRMKKADLYSYWTA